jgi:hypothetical protein
MDDVEIDRALRAALSESPSPDFVPRLRNTIADAQRPCVFAGAWKPIVGFACVAVVAVAIILRQDARLKPSPTGLAAVAATTVPSAPSVVVPTFPHAMASAAAGRLATIKSAKAPTRVAYIEPPMPEVLIAQKDIEALREFIASANEVRFTASFDETPAPTPWLVSELPTAEAHNN